MKHQIRYGSPRERRQAPDEVSLLRACDLSNRWDRVGKGNAGGKGRSMPCLAEAMAFFVQGLVQGIKVISGLAAQGREM